LKFFCSRITKVLAIFVISFAAGHALVIECNYINETIITDAGEMYTCVNATIIEYGNDKTVTNTTGTHEVGKSNNDVEGFLTELTFNLTDFPVNLAGFFPKLRVLLIYAPDLTSISSESLKLPFLEGFVMFFSQIVSIDGNLFQHTPNLKWIYFVFNKIQHIGHNLLTNLPNLKEVGFISNPCINNLTFANTPAAIQELNRQLPIFCPPLSPTTLAPTTIISPPLQ
jgi:Leucine-rich repeat (LRR) protein